MQVSGTGIFDCMFRRGCLWDGKDRLPAHQKSQSNLARCGVVSVGDLLQNASSRGMRAGKTSVTEWTVSNQGDAMLLAPRQHRVFNGTLFQMIEHLIACHAAFTGDGRGLFKIWYVEVTHAPGKNFSFVLQPLESANSAFQRMFSAPMHEITI